MGVNGSTKQHYLRPCNADLMHKLVQYCPQRKTQSRAEASWASCTHVHICIPNTDENSLEGPWPTWLSTFPLLSPLTPILLGCKMTGAFLFKASISETIVPTYMLDVIWPFPNRFLQRKMEWGGGIAGNFGFSFHLAYAIRVSKLKSGWFFDMVHCPNWLPQYLVAIFIWFWSLILCH